MISNRLTAAALTSARAVKHRTWVGARSAREGGFQALAKVRDPVFERRYAGSVYTYEPGAFRRSFLNWDAAVPPIAAKPVPRRIYCFWTGENELTDARRRSLDVMRDALGIPVVLVTADDLPRYTVPGAPLHPAYDGLSYNHRSDYLRAYFMHHHGGGYQDIKTPAGSWTDVFDAMDEDPNTWFAGYPERTSLWVGRYPGELGRELRRRYAALPGGSACVAKPGTQLTAEWLAEVNRRLDYYSELISASPGGMWGRDPAYPVSWNRLNAQVLHPLALKFHRHVWVTSDMRPVHSNHR